MRPGVFIFTKNGYPSRTKHIKSINIMNPENFILLLPSCFYLIGVGLLVFVLYQVLKKLRHISQRMDVIHKELHNMDMRITINEVRMEERKPQALLPAPVKRGRKPKSS